MKPVDADRLQALSADMDIDLARSPAHEIGRGASAVHGAASRPT